MRRTRYFYLRVVMLSDGTTVHNAFFDRDFEPTPSELGAAREEE